ncbi:MAG TPA: hypothetical protein VFO20_11585 [Propionibacteriaceae bacterium]|nr:hypothetical protein [Propionibacteriaceae bacterium]
MNETTPRDDRRHHRRDHLRFLEVAESPSKIEKQLRDSGTYVADFRQ